MSKKLRHQAVRNFVSKQDKVLKEEVELHSKRGQEIILRDFLFLQSEHKGQLTEDFYRLRGRYPVDRVDKLFRSFGAALVVYQKSLRPCLKCSIYILKPDWLCKSCRHSNAEIEDYL